MEFFVIVIQRATFFGTWNGDMFPIQGSKGMMKLTFMTEEIGYNSWRMVGQAITSSLYSSMMPQHTSFTMQLMVL